MFLLIWEETSLLVYLPPMLKGQYVVSLQEADFFCQFPVEKKFSPRGNLSRSLKLNCVTGLLRDQKACKTLAACIRCFELLRFTCKSHTNINLVEIAKLIFKMQYFQAELSVRWFVPCDNKDQIYRKCISGGCDTVEGSARMQCEIWIAGICLNLWTMLVMWCGKDRLNVQL